MYSQHYTSTIFKSTTVMYLKFPLKGTSSQRFFFVFVNSFIIAIWNTSEQLLNLSYVIFTPIQFRVDEKRLKANWNEALTRSLKLAPRSHFSIIVGQKLAIILKCNSSTASLSLLNNKLTEHLQMNKSYS